MRIVAIGASAGGLEPIEQFFDMLPDGTGMAYVIIQHLSPDFRSMMPELLKRHSKLNIQIITDGMPLEAEKIYLNPPRASLEIKDGRFHLIDQKDPNEPSLPINNFFHSLAREYGEKAVCIVLSGTGSDGTLGAESIATAGGLVMAQDPSSAKFESMPRSVLEAIPGAIYASPSFLPRLFFKATAGELEPRSAKAIKTLTSPERDIIATLQGRFGLDFGYYKAATVARRIKRRAHLMGMENLADYAATLTENPEELEQLYADLLIGVTTFFRDPEAFRSLEETVSATLDEKLKAGDEIRVWTPGCASGEEAYSIAIMLAERARNLEVEPNIRIFGTDIHERSLKIASAARYPLKAAGRMPKDVVGRYFTTYKDEIHAKKFLRDYIVFSQHNLIKDPPFTRMDLVSCRNLLIYFNEEAQRKAIAMFHFALRQGSPLFLGPSETLGGLSDEFNVVDSRWRIYVKRRNVRLLEATRLLPLTTENPSEEEGRIHSDYAHQEKVSHQEFERHSLMKAYDAVLAKTVGTSLLVSRAGSILHIFSDAGKFLSFKQGGFSQKVTDLVDDQLSITISAGLDRIQNSNDAEFVRLVNFKGETSGRLTVRMCSINFSHDSNDSPVLIAFSPIEEDPIDVAAPTESFEGKEGEAYLRHKIDVLERDLQFSEQTLQSTIEELETSNEELQATNEELQATNEELMAANEELQTVNEELHAVNEELYTVSAEHQSKIGELTSITTDLDNLLQSTKIGVLFLDSNKHIRQITPAVSDTFNILARDIGRPIGHVTSRFDFPDLDEAIDKVVNGEGTIERTIQVDGRDFLLRLLPYKRDAFIDGAVMTFVDISEMARLNRNLIQFADIVSHDLKAPIRAIRTTANWIIEDLKNSQEQEEISAHTDRLVNQTDRLSQMLSDLRDFSIFSQEDQRPERIDIVELVNDICADYQGEQLSLEIEGALPVLETIITPIRLVFQNIISNAVKHNDQDQTVLYISAYEKNDFWVFTLRDNGPGIDKRHHDKIFLPFRKLKPVEESKGSGIGLALARKAVEGFGGVIEVSSDPGVQRGSEFTFTWPNS